MRSWIRRLRPIRENSIATEWNRQYSTGRWDFLADLEEMARYWIVAGYCANRFERPAVLDIGCGVGLLEEKLRSVPYSVYTGVDISTDALKEGRARMPKSCRLVCADFLNFFVTDRYDAIVFMGVFLPGMPASEILKRYCDFLRPGGRIILCEFDGRDRKTAIPMWNEVKKSFQLEDAIRVENLPSEKSWTIGLLAP